MSAPTRASVVQLSLDEYALAWERLGLGLRHWNLNPPGGAVRTAEERATLQQRAWEGLRERDLARGRDLAPQLEDALHVIARAPEEINGKVDTPGGRVHVVGGARSGFVVVAELYPQGLRLRFPRDDLAAALVAPLPDRPPVPGSAVSAPSDAVAVDTFRSGAEVEQALVRSGVRQEDAHRFRTVIEGPRLLGAKFGAARRDRHGRRHPSEFVVTYVGTERGGYTIEQRRAPDRRQWLTIAPADKQALAQRLQRLVGSIRM